MTNDLKVGNPWFSMWTKPRQTIREIILTNPKRQFIPLSVIYGFPMLLQLAQNLSLGLHMHWGAIVLVALLCSVVAGMLGLTITAALMHWTGRWLGGKSNFLEMRAAVSWANVTNVVISLSWLALAIIFRQELFIDNFINRPFIGNENGLVFMLFGVQSLVSIWSIFILVHAVGEVQQFSAWKGLLNLIISIFIIIAIVGLVGFLITYTMNRPLPV